MQIEVNREACCAQDDQMGPLSLALELPDDSSLGDLVARVVAARFLQYSATHTALRCRIAGELVATVFSPYQSPVRAPEFVASPATLLRGIATERRVVFNFDPR